ncbi:MAG: Asp-tRNA(Asn)/Glu-tRNA(Gln) amidotransferase subunit GatB [Pirellulaceae bacterium]
MTSPDYEIVIGLEVHVQLKTVSKLFCGCSTEFGAEPNTQTCPVCTGLPGSLPVLNGQAMELSLRTAVALNCEIPRLTKWDRKNYYYPDLPKGYQISQFDLPMSQHGWLMISDPEGEFEERKIRIIRAHLEEDAGKSMHDEEAGIADSRIDLNRTGTPLLEIVSEPDIRSPRQARIFLTELKLLLGYLDVSDCNMQEGSLRVDANINLHIPDQEGVIATPIVEVKNVNSFRAVERAMHFEAERQYERWQQTGERLGDVSKQTRGWDDQAQVTRAQRHKEESSDYRYLPDPDLVPVIVPAERVELIRTQTGELPAALRDRLQQQYMITAYTADVIVNQGRPLVDYFVELAEKSGNAVLAGNWIQQDVLRTLKELEISIEQFTVPAASLAELLTMMDAGQLDNSRGRDLLQAMIESGDTLEQSVARLGIEQVDDAALEELCRQLVEDNPHVVTDVQAGKQQAVGALVGKARQQNSNVNPARIKEICLELISQLPSAGENP